MSTRRKSGDDVIILPAVTKQEAKLRIVPQPKVRREASQCLSGDRGTWQSPPFFLFFRKPFRRKPRPLIRAS